MSTVSKPAPAPAPVRNPLRLQIPAVQAAPRPATRSTWRKLPWILGIAAAAVSLAGAGHVLQSKSDDSPPTSGRDSKSAASQAGTGSYSHGTVDVDGGVLNLWPTQMGEIVQIAVTEGQSVKEGDLILKINEEPAHLAIKQAEAGVNAAKELVEQAKNGIEQLKHGLTKQQSAIDAARSKQSAAESEFHRLEKLKAENLANENQINTARQLLNAAKAALAAEEAEYRRIQSLQPETKVREAQAGLDLAKERLQAEKYKLDKCSLRAPFDGKIIRINAGRGALVTTQMRQPPVLLCPNGPRIVRAELLPEFAHRVHPGMEATVSDESNPSVVWTGKVKRLADAYLPKRTQGDTLTLSTNESLLLECIVELAQSPNPPRIGQRVRVAIGARP